MARGLIAEYFMQEIAKLPTQSFLASEFRYKKFFAHKRTLTCIISQSGETADSLEALRLLGTSGQTTIALTNVASSSMVREADGFLLTQAGQEIAVASTKAFTAQVSALYWLAHWIAHIKGLITSQAITRAEEELLLLQKFLKIALNDINLILFRASRHSMSSTNILFSLVGTLVFPLHLKPH